MTDDSTPDQRPVLRVVRGDATPEDIAAIVAVLAAAGGGEEERQPAGMSLWRKQTMLRTMPHPGRDSWRASGLPT